MAPNGGKRKRNERDSMPSGADNRPSPHRPGNADLARREHSEDMRNGNRRSSRGGRGGGRQRYDRRETVGDPISNSTSGTQPALPGPMSPPPPQTSNVGQSQAPQSTVTATSVSQTPAPPPQPKREPKPYDCAHVTDARLSAWSADGRQEAVNDGAQALHDCDELELSIIFQEFLRAALDDRIRAEDAGNCIKEILGPETSPEVDNAETIDGPKLFLDSLSILVDAETFDPILRDVILASGVSQTLMRHVLDAQLLQDLGLTRSTFIKTGIRQVTNFLYRQSNHNLLREETEGYSKLVTELFSTSATSGGEPPSSDVAEETFERVKGLIGTFNLDVGRVLDVTMDVFAAVLIKQFRFFVKFLRVSSWWPRDSNFSSQTVSGYNQSGLPNWALPGSTEWHTTEAEEELAIPLRKERDQAFWHRAREIGVDAFFELGGRRAADDDEKASFLSKAGDDDVEVDADRQWIEATGTLPPSGNRVAAQLLGFKLRFYASEAREKDDVLPANLIYLAALLIKVGFISLRDLYPHLWPLDVDMDGVKETRLKELAEKEKLNRPGGGKNALMTAGALADDTIPSAGRIKEISSVKTDTSAMVNGTESEVKEELPEPADQKISLLINLLTIGALPEALYILGRFPWIPEAFPEIYDLLHRILHRSISQVYETGLTHGFGETEFPAKKPVDHDQSSAPKGSVRRSDPSTRKALRWPFPDRFDVNEGMIYRFYWDEWADNIPVCQDVDDVFTLCSTLLNISGVNIGRDVSLLSKIASIGGRSLAHDHSEANLERWRDLLKRLLVPALSFTKSNTNVVNEIYDILRYYPAPVRYNIYAEWFEGATSRLPAIQVAFARTRLETLSTMKRISMTNLTAMARTLAKTAYASPGVVFKVALDQIEAYSNLTEVVVECAKYFTDLGYDVLIWSLMSSLGGKSRTRTRADAALLTSRWLIALSKFSGKVFRRYSIMNPAPILQYVNDQLYRGNSTDLIILEELIAQMAGVVPDTDFTDAQLLAMTGGEILRRQTLISLQDRRFETVKTAKRLMRSLIETRLAGQLLVSIAQHRQSSIFAIPEEDAHIKFLATLIDEAQRILVQYLDLLRSNLSVDQFDELVPNTPELMSDFGLEPSLAFLIGRASFASRLAAVQAPSGKIAAAIERAANDAIPQVGTNGIVSIVEPVVAQMLENDDSDVAKDATIPSAGDTLMEDSPEVNGDATQSAQASPSPSTDSWQEVMAPLVAAVQDALPEKTWLLLSPEFYAIFWQLSLADINLPMDSYTAENTRLTKEIQELMRDRSDMSRTGIARREEARKRLEATRDDLLKESKQEMIRYERSRSRLNKEKTCWFVNIHGKFDSLNDSLLEECFIPRLLMSPSDADYCFKMIKFLHNYGTPNFRTLGLYARLFRANRLRSLIFSCTIREAETFGRFLKSILGDLARWHVNKTTYEKESLGSNRDLPGFATKLGDDGKPLTVLEYEEFRRVHFGWHKNLNNALKTCLGGTEWMHIRNAITVLKAVVEYFPAVDFMGKAFQTTLREIGKREKEVREDLSLTANALLPELKKREGRWVMPQAFASNLSDPSHQWIGQQANAGKTATPQSDVKSTKTPLKATAPEFKPQSHVTSGSFTTKTTLMEVEDGELADLKPTAPDATLASKDESSNHNPQFGRTSGTPDTSRANEMSTTTPQEQNELKTQDHTGVHSGPETPRNVSANMTRERPDSVLPRRPDGPVPTHSDLDRHRFPRHGDSRDVRDGRLGRSDRHGDLPRDLSNQGRRVPEHARDSNRFHDRGTVSERERHEPGRYPSEPSRDQRDGWDSRDRVPADVSRMADLNARIGGDEDPRDMRRQTSQGPQINPERLPLLDQREGNVNLARVELISKNDEAIRGGPATSRDIRGSRPISRPVSPRGDRFASDQDYLDGRRSERSMIGRSAAPDMQDPSRRREPGLAPSGPRDRPGDRGPMDRIRGASAFVPTQQQHRAMNPDHGRLSQPSDSDFGRLNPAPVPEVPSGPRDRSSRGPVGNRITSAPQPRGEPRNMRQEPPMPPAPERGPPTGPASTRNLRGRGSGEPNASSSNSISTNTTTGAASTVTGVHPDRLAHLPSQTIALPAPARAPTPPPPIEAGVHPDRLRAIQAEPPPVQSPNYRSGPGGPPLGAPPPSGPRSAQVVNTSSSSPVGVTPTGPSLANDRSNRPNRSFAGMQKILTEAGQLPTPERPGNERITNIKGRGGRGSVGGSEAFPNSAASTPTGPALRQEFPRDAGPGKDLIDPDRLVNLRESNGPGDERDSRVGGRGRESSSRHGRDGGRRSHRPSMSGSPERGPERERDRRDRDRGAIEEERGRRSNHRGDPRELRGGGHGRDERGRQRPRDMGPGSEEPGRDRIFGRREGDKSHENAPPPPLPFPPPSRDGPEWLGPSRDHGRRGQDVRSGNDRRGGHGRDDGGRKRHSEGSAIDHRVEKRPRR
ncbi:MAG: THO complex subunit 2 [Claussenomyces sp. TS43310]|nr:MAG: THO complex subunit 2 [Claussenomyces sp. TS43310]